MTELGAQSADASKRQSVDEEVKQLITILRDEQLRESEPERVVQAIEWLGKMRVVEAIDDLVALLTFRQTLEWEKGMPSNLHVETTSVGPDRRYPATGALFQIGKPALPALIHVIGTHESGSLESENAIYAVGFANV